MSDANTDHDWWIDPVVGICFVKIDPGTFADSWDQEVHYLPGLEELVPFWMSLNPVTCQQFGRFDARSALLDSAKRNDPTDPVVDVNYGDATAFCLWLAGEPGGQAALPREAHWRCACAMGSARGDAFGEDDSFWEWSRDVYGSEYSAGNRRGVGGAPWDDCDSIIFDFTGRCRVASDHKGWSLGFRVVV